MSCWRRCPTPSPSTRTPAARPPARRPTPCPTPHLALWIASTRSPARAAHRTGDHRRGRARHEPVPHCRAPGSWAKLCPRTIQSGAKSTAGKTGKGNRYLRCPGRRRRRRRQNQHLPGERYRRIIKRRGKLKALVAVARSILVIIWNQLTVPPPGTTTSAPTTTPRGSTPNAAPATTSATDSARLQGHPRTRRLNRTPTGTTSPGSARPAGYCRLPTHLGYFSDQAFRAARSTSSNCSPRRSSSYALRPPRRPIAVWRSVGTARRPR